jgi:hypothetical protein
MNQPLRIFAAALALYAAAPRCLLPGQTVIVPGELSPVTLPQPPQPVPTPAALPTQSPPPANQKPVVEFIRPVDFHAVTLSLQTAIEQLRGATGNAKDASAIIAATLSGEWKQLQSLLHAQPDPAAADAVYLLLLEKLAGTTQRIAAVAPPQEARYNKLAERPDKQRKHMLVAADYIGLLEAAPSRIGDAHLAHLKAIAAAIGADLAGPLSRRLAEGLPGLGGRNDPSARAQAAVLLLSLGALSEASGFLPVEKQPDSPEVTIPELLALTELFTRKASEEKSEEPILKAALTCTALAKRTAPSDATALESLCSSLLTFLAELDAPKSVQFLRTEIFPKKDLTEAVLLSITKRSARNLASTDEKTRRTTLDLHHRLMEALSSLPMEKIPPTARTLALHWLDEAETTIRYTPEQKRSDDARETIGRIYSFEPQQQTFLAFQRDELRQCSPTEVFLDKLPHEIGQRTRFARMRLKLADPVPGETLDELKRYISRYGCDAPDLCRQFLLGWAGQRSTPKEDPELERMRSRGFFIPNTSRGLPQTRARQEAALRELSSLIRDLESLAGAALKPAAKANAFVMIHSDSEVFRIEDIESVFGPAEQIPFESIALIIQTMRERLATEWADPGVQQKAGTNRTESEIKQEVSRGYTVASELIRRSRTRTVGDWKGMLQHAMVLFDSAEFHFKYQGALADYITERKQALDALRESAIAYERAVPNLRPAEWSLDAYLAWTSAMLGATDPTRLKWKEHRPEPAFIEIHDALRRLPANVRERHLSDFARLCRNVIDKVPSQMRHKFLDAAVHVVGSDVTEILPCVELLNHYVSLTAEARLRVKVDGPTRVGNGQPFGLELSVEHTEKLGRESGGFGKYLRNPGALNQNNPYVMYGLKAPKQINYRDEFQKNIHRALQDSFEVQGITFHEANVTPLPAHEAGWQSTPLAYVVLKTKDISVDRIPSIQLDLEFAEGKSQVVLPVVSQVEPLATASSISERRPVRALHILQTLDQRESEQGKLSLDINAKGEGLIPDLESLFESIEVSGFDLTVADQPNSVGEFKTDNGNTVAASERNWQLIYRRKTDLQAEARFKFPVKRQDIEAQVDYKRFEDADLITLTETEAARGFLFSRAKDRAAWWTFAGITAILLAAVGRHWLQTRGTKPVAITHSLPEVITPFTTLAHLRSALDGTTSARERERIANAIAELERRCFSPQPNPPDGAELRSILLSQSPEASARTSPEILTSPRAAAV